MNENTRSGLGENTDFEVLDGRIKEADPRLSYSFTIREADERDVPGIARVYQRVGMDEAQKAVSSEQERIKAELDRLNRYSKEGGIFDVLSEERIRNQINDTRRNIFLVIEANKEGERSEIIGFYSSGTDASDYVEMDPYAQNMEWMSDFLDDLKQAEWFDQFKLLIKNGKQSKERYQRVTDREIVSKLRSLKKNKMRKWLWKIKRSNPNSAVLTMDYLSKLDAWDQHLPDKDCSAKALRLFAEWLRDTRLVVGTHDVAIDPDWRGLHLYPRVMSVMYNEILDRTETEEERNGKFVIKEIYEICSKKVGDEGDYEDIVGGAINETSQGFNEVLGAKVVGNMPRGPLEVGENIRVKVKSTIFTYKIKDALEELGRIKRDKMRANQRNGRRSLANKKTVYEVSPLPDSAYSVAM